MVISSLGGGGAERVVCDLCRHLQTAGRDVFLLTLSGEDPDAYNVPPGVVRQRLEIRRPARSLLHSVIFTRRHLTAMRRMILSFRPDVVIAFLEQTNVRTLASLTASGIPVIVSERNHTAVEPISRLWAVARRLTYPMATSVVVLTHETAAWFERWLGSGRVTVIPNAVRRVEDLTPSDENVAPDIPRPLVLAVGRLVEQKGFDLLLEAFHRANLKSRGWKLAILGNGPERDALRRRAAALDLSDAFLMPGFVPDIGRWLSCADLFVVSSRYEGMSNVLMEAMQMGRACISFDCPSGPRTLIEHGRDGWLVPAQDVDALAGALRRFAAMPDARARLGFEAAKVSERFRPAAVYGSWLSLVDVAAAGRRRAAAN